MEVVGGPPVTAAAGQDQNPQQNQAAPEQVKAERLNAAVQQQINLESVKTRAVGLYNAISRILQHIDVYSRSNSPHKCSLPVMLSSKLLPEMETEDSSKRELLLSGIVNFPVTMQIEKLKARIDMIAAACDTAEKVIADACKQYGLGSHQGPNLVPNLDKVQAEKIQEQENLLSAAVNLGRSHDIISL